jgi:hypothetical protein
MAQKVQNPLHRGPRRQRGRPYCPFRARRRRVRDRHEHRARPATAGGLGAVHQHRSPRSRKHWQLSPQPPQDPSRPRPDTTEVREWARAQGIDVKGLWPDTCRASGQVQDGNRKVRSDAETFDGSPGGGNRFARERVSVPPTGQQLHHFPSKRWPEAAQRWTVAGPDDLPALINYRR